MDRNAPLFAGVAILAILVIGTTMAFAPLGSTTSASGTSTITTSTGSAAPGTIILPSGTTFQVSSSYDCVAGHYSVPFTAQDPSLLTGGFSAGRPGVTMYLATAQQASEVTQGHPSTWTYSTGLQNTTHFRVALGAGSYVAWFEGADLNCGATMVTPLEQLTNVTITETLAVQYTLLSSTAAASTSPSGAVDVRVAVGPTMPVCSVNVTSGPQPSGFNSSISAIVTDSSGDTMTLPLDWVSTGCSVTGSVSVPLNPGAYSLSLSSCPWVGCNSAIPRGFTILAGQTTGVEISVDTGIR